MSLDNRTKGKLLTEALGQFLFKMGALLGFGALVGWFAGIGWAVNFGEWGFGLCFGGWFVLILIGAFVFPKPKHPKIESQP